MAKKTKKGIEDEVTKSIDAVLERGRLAKSEPLRRAAIAKHIREKTKAELAKIEGAGVSDPTANVPVKPSTQVAIPEDSRYHKLVKLQSLFKLEEHVKNNKHEWGGGSTVTALPPSRPFSNRPETITESYFAMYNYFKEIGNWSVDDLTELEDYSMQGAGFTQTTFLLEHGFLKEVNPRWIDINPDRIKPHKPKGFVAKEPDGIKKIPMWQFRLPEIDVEHRKETGQTQIGLNKDGSPKLKNWTKFYKREYDYEITSKGRKYIQEKFKRLEPAKGISDIETFLPSEKEPSSTLLEDVAYEVLPSDKPVDPNTPLTYEEILQSEGTLRGSTSRQDAITEAKKRREERKQSRGYVDKPVTSKPPTELGAPRMPSLTGKAAGKSALPGGGFPSKKLPPKFRMGGFIPYST